MTDDPTPGPDATDVDAADAETREDILDKFDDAVIAADATGMVAGERLITDAEIEAGLGEVDTTGDV
jgi:hypothetical protein